ncbi:hypothetical protein ACN4EG_26200 [Alkalinema pantanalense CENA528]|uniref:hypothetical protein n=1 Tax=Alkalinema pantanalense TaxID=1620705 RepID=UPI003D6FD375
MTNNPILNQINALWRDMQDPKTGGTLLDALKRLFHLLFQFFLLAVLLILLAFAAIVWLGGVAFQTGRDDRQWVKEHPEMDGNGFALYIASKNLLAPFKWLSLLSNYILYKLLGFTPANTALPATDSKALSGGSAIGSMPAIASTKKMV